MILPYDSFNEEQIDAFFSGNDIDAVLCVNEIFAIHCMGIVQKQGFRIPEDIAFIGFTDGILSKYSKPRLTTIAQHGDKMGELAAQMLIERVENENEEIEEVFLTEIIEATLIKRESTSN
jgi:LacI family transcriptional regulator